MGKLKVLRSLTLNISSYAPPLVSNQSPPDPTHNLAILLTQVMGDLLTTLAIVGTLEILAILGALAMLDTLEILDTLAIVAMLGIMAMSVILAILGILAIHLIIILQTLAMSIIEDKLLNNAYT